MSRELVELSTPGEVLKEEFLDPMGITPYAPAKGIFVDPPPNRRDHQGQEEDYRRHGHQTVKILWNYARFLDEHAESL